MKIIYFLLIILLSSCSIEEKEEKYNFQNVEKELRSVVEQAYFEGQRDAINNDIRIKKEGGKWVWVKSPWDDGLKPVFDPSK